MKVKLQSGRRAFTVIEMLVVIAVIAVVVSMLLPSLATSGKSPMIGCMNNLRQVAIAEAMWGSDHGGKFSARASTNAEGSLEYLVAGQLNRHLQNLTSYLYPAALLSCPADDRKRAASFGALENSNISYFASLDAQRSKTNLFLAGDRNLGLNGSAVRSGVLTLAAGSSVPGWTKGMHNRTGTARRGVVAFSDGHAEVLANRALPATLRKFGLDTNRLVFP